MTQFHSIAAGAHRATARHRGLDVTYSRGAASVGVKAVPATQRINVDDGAGFSVVAQERDWLIEADRLTFENEPVTPEAGDQIRLVTGAGVLVYEVNALPGEKPYRPSDAMGTVLRIHTRHIDTE